MRNQGSRKLIVLVLSMLFLSAASGCKSEFRNVTPGIVHRGSGIIESIDKDLASIQINHEEIKDYMPAMSMPYQVRDKSILDDVRPGDRIEFSLESTGKGDVVTEIKKIDAQKSGRD